MVAGSKSPSCLLPLVFVWLTAGQAVQSALYQSSMLSAELLLEKSCRLSLEDRECRCAYKSAGTQCCCVGTNIAAIPANLPSKTTALFLYNTSIEAVGVEALRNYLYLEKFHVSSSHKLKIINGSAFERLRKLRKIFISNCSELVKIVGTLLHRNHRLQSVVINNNERLEHLPYMEMNEHHRLTIDLLDLSHNSFRAIKTGRIRGIFAQNALFTGNQLEIIESEAFRNCQFIKLNFSDNPNLHRIAVDAFVGMLKANELDLSGSRLTELPVHGLKKLERLRLLRVPTLKKLPSVLAFNNLHTAEFTYPYHCCFFKYATREYERGGDWEFHQHYKEIQQRVCNRRTTLIGENLLRRRRDWEVPDFRGDEKNKNFDFIMWLDEMSELNLVNMTDEEQNPFSGDQLGKSVVIQKCVDTAVANFYLNITCMPQPDALNPCEDIVSYPTLRLFLWPMCITALLGNIAVWITIAAVWQRRLRYHYFFMLNLSIADFLTGVYLAFLAIADSKTANEYYNFAVEWQTGWGCSLAGFINVFASELSIVSMLMIAVEIYYNARFAFYGKRMSALVAYGAISIGYVYAIVAAALPLFGVSSYEVSSICLPLSISSLTDRIYITTGLITTALAFVGMIVNYVLINLMVRGGKNVPSRGEDKQILYRTLVLIGTDIACWFPTLFFGLTAALGHPLITLTNAKICLILFYPINSCANPVLYVFLSKIWKDAKQKAPFLEKLSSKHDKTKSQVNPFYYRHSPVNKSCPSPSSPDEELTRLLQVTQTMSLNSTPRGSSSSTPLVQLSNSDLFSNSLLNAEQPISSRTLFQENHFDPLLMEKKRKSVSPMPIIRLRVSAAPEMSDISENSSNSAEDYDRRTKNRHKTSVISRLIIDAASQSPQMSYDKSLKSLPTEIALLAQQEQPHNTDANQDDSFRCKTKQNCTADHFQCKSTLNWSQQSPDNLLHPR